jgi:hypothetical protein
MIHLSNENQNIYALAIKDFKYPNYQYVYLLVLYH